MKFKSLRNNKPYAVSTCDTIKQAVLTFQERLKHDHDIKVASGLLRDFALIEGKEVMYQLEFQFIGNNVFKVIYQVYTGEDTEYHEYGGWTEEYLATFGEDFVKTLFDTASVSIREDVAEKMLKNLSRHTCNRFHQPRYV